MNDLAIWGGASGAPGTMGALAAEMSKVACRNFVSMTDTLLLSPTSTRRERAAERSAICICKASCCEPGSGNTNFAYALESCKSIPASIATSGCSAL